MTKKKEALATEISAEPLTTAKGTGQIAIRDPDAKAPAKKAPIAAPGNDNPLANVVNMLERVVSNPDYPIEKVEQAFNFMQRVQADQAKKTWNRDFVLAQAEMEQIKAEATNPQTSSKYATFDALDAVLRPIYSRHGFAMTHTTEEHADPLMIRVVTYVIHRDGHRERYQIDMPTDGKGAKGNDVMTRTHAVGSGNTYGKRYNVGNAWNVAVFRDDDGNAAGKGAKSRPVTVPADISTSAAERIKLVRELHEKARPLSAEDLEDFATKHASVIATLRPEDATHVRNEVEIWMKAPGEAKAIEAKHEAAAAARKKVADDGL